MLSENEQLLKGVKVKTKAKHYQSNLPPVLREHNMKIDEVKQTMEDLITRYNDIVRQNPKMVINQ